MVICTKYHFQAQHKQLKQRLTFPHSRIQSQTCFDPVQHLDRYRAWVPNFHARGSSLYRSVKFNAHDGRDKISDDRNSRKTAADTTKISFSYKASSRQESLKFTIRRSRTYFGKRARYRLTPGQRRGAWQNCRRGYWTPTRDDFDAAKPWPNR